MRALITGSEGFVGRHLSRELVSSGYDVVECSLNGYYKMDVTNFSQVLSIIQDTKPDAIFHLAALAYVPSSWINPRFTFGVNTLGSLNVFEAIRSLGVDTKIHIAGSSEEYGLVYESETPVTEDQPLRPLSPYGVSKVAMDLLAYQYFRSYGMKIIRTRAFNHEGYGRGPQYMPSTFAKQLIEIKLGLKKPVILHGDLTSKRDITDVRDTACAYRLALEKCEPGEVYNIGTGNVYTAGEVLDKLISLSGVKVKKKQDPKRMRPSDVKLLQCDPTKFKKRTGWKPKYSIDDTLSETLRYWEEKIRLEKKLS